MNSFENIGCRGIHQSLRQGVWMWSRILKKRLHRGIFQSKMRYWPFIIHSPILLLMTSCRYSLPARARRASIRLQSSLSTYPKQTTNRCNEWAFIMLEVKQNVPLSHKSRVNVVSTIGFMQHIIAKIGPPVDRDRFKMSAIWLAMVKSLVRK